MNYREIIGPDELDWKVVPLDWKKIGKEELKMGTPMSKDGVEANDASCYGILMDDVVKGKHEQARVIVSGCVDFTKAEEYSGIKISAEAKKAIGKVWSQGGGGLTELPEGYPYKEQSEAVLLAEQTLAFTYGQTVCIIDREVTAGKTYRVTWNGQTETAVAIEATDLGASARIPFGDKYIFYAYDMGNHGLVLADPTQPETATIGITEFAETIHTMAPEFLPLLTSPNGTKYKLTVSDDGTLSAVKV